MWNGSIHWFFSAPDRKSTVTRGCCFDCGQVLCESRMSCPHPKVYSCLYWHPVGTIRVVDEEQVS